MYTHKQKNAYFSDDLKKNYVNLNDYFNKYHKYTYTHTHTHARLTISITIQLFIIYVSRKCDDIYIYIMLHNIKILFIYTNVPLIS